MSLQTRLSDLVGSIATAINTDRARLDTLEANSYSGARLGSYSNSTTTYATAISVDVPTLGEYRIYNMQSFFTYDSNTSEGFKFRFLISGHGGTAPLLRYRLGVDAVTDLERQESTDHVLGGDANNRAMSAHGSFLIHNTTTGTVTLSLQIAQNASGATAARIFGNSYLDLRRVY